MSPSSFSPRHRFSDWPNADIPAVAAGVYAVWESETLVYCGMSGRKLEKAVGPLCTGANATCALCGHTTESMA